MRDGQPFEAHAFRFLVDRKGDGQLTDGYFDVRCSPLPGHGEEAGVLTFAVDVTPHVLARQALDAEAGRLQQAVEARDELLSVASHELRTPLAVLRLQVQALQRSIARAGEDGGEPDLSRHELNARLGAANRQVDRLVELIDSLLDVSRLQSGQLHLAPVEVDLPQLAAEVVERSRPAAAAAASTLTLEVADAALAGMWDRSRVDQILTNLVSNAVKYGLGKPIFVRVGSEAGAGGPRAFLTVSDEGIGIAPADHARIFDRFARAVPRECYSGLGLGLWISRQLAESLGGSLTVDSALGQGARFTLSLPL
jgi:signal transduction histidine kinase